jgi:hypothetical protein
MRRIYLGSKEIALLLAVLFHPALTLGQGRDTGCARKPIPLSLNEDRNISVLHSWLSFEKVLRGELTLRNNSNLALTAITLVVNYLDKDDNTLFAITYQANVKGFSNTALNIRAFSEVRLDNPVEPNGVIHMSASNLLSTTETPARAVASVLNITFLDGTGRNSGVLKPIWHSQPMLDRADGSIKLALDVASEPVYIAAELKINEYGNVTAVEPIGGPLTAAQIQSLSRQLATWHFFPAIENGYGVPDTLAIVLQFQPTDAVPTHHCFLGHPEAYPKIFAYFILERQSGKPDSWQAYYDDYPVDTHFPKSVVVEDRPAQRVH